MSREILRFAQNDKSEGLNAISRSPLLLYTEGIMAELQHQIQEIAERVSHILVRL